MKEEQFLKELKAKGFDYSEPECNVHYGDDLCFKSAKLAFAKDYKVTTTNMTYWLRFSDSLDEHLFGIEIEGFIGPNAKTVEFLFNGLLNSLNLKQVPKQKVPPPNLNRMDLRKY